MKTSLWVEQLTLLETSVIMVGALAHQPGGDGCSGGEREELPILKLSMDPEHADLDAAVKARRACAEGECENNHHDDEMTSQATVAMEDDEHEVAAAGDGEEETAAASSAVTPTKPGFVGRLVREYTLKREINLLIAKKQQQLDDMQNIIVTYQTDLLRWIGQLENEASELRGAEQGLRGESQHKVGEMLRTGVTRDCIEVARCVGLLEIRRNRILQERALLRKSIVETRHEECEWLLKSIVAQHESECDELMSATTAKKFLDEGSLHATLSVQISQNDPIFAGVDHLFEAQSDAKRLELQLDSVDTLLDTMKAKRDDLEAQYVVPSGPVPLMKRSSFRERKQTEVFPSPDRKRQLKRLLRDATAANFNKSCSIEARRVRYAACLQTFSRIAADLRTRTGRLLGQFVEQLHDDTSESIILRKVRTLNDVSDQQAEEKRDEPRAHRTSDVVDRYFVCGLFRQLTKIHYSDDCTDESHGVPVERILHSGPAVDSLKLPPPAMISAFARFLVRSVKVEYELESHEDETIDCGDQPEAAGDIDDDVLQDCIHEMVFSRISVIAAASALEEYRSGLDDDDTGTGEYPWHWVHSKRRVQGISPIELAFPDEVLDSISGFLSTHVESITRHGFLPRTLSMFRAVESEVTPKGVIRTIMGGFRVLHVELMAVLAFTPATDLASGRRRRGSCFLNADVLIPSLVLMMTRLPNSAYLDHLWLRVKLVEAFQTSILSHGGEDAYYLTCLAAAMEFINTFELTSALQQPHREQRLPCDTCSSFRAATGDNVSIQVDRERLVTSSAPPLLASSRSAEQLQQPSTTRKALRSQSTRTAWTKTTDHDSVKQLSSWISDQPLTDWTSCIVTDRLLPNHETWIYEHKAV